MRFSSSSLAKRISSSFAARWDAVVEEDLVECSDSEEEVVEDEAMDWASSSSMLGGV